jgi:Tfp pilus assembly protein PilF
VRSKSWWYTTSLIPVALAAFAAAPAPKALNVPQALAEQHRIVAADPASAAAQVDLGNLLLLDGKTGEAEAAYRQAIALDPASINAHFDLGLLLQQTGEARSAGREYSRVLELDPNHAWAHYQIGVLRENAGSENAAVRAYAKAFALDPRLAFPDVNPHVLENKLVTAAMLRAYDRELPPLQPGAAYEEPTRIAGLLIGKTQAAAAVAGTDLSEPGAASSADAITEPARTSAAQTLRPGDLSRVGNAGQATGAGATTTRRGSRPVIVEGEGSEEPELEIYEPPVPTLRIPTPTDPSTGVVPTPYQPGQPSTGRLEMHLRDAWGREIGRG